MIAHQETTFWHALPTIIIVGLVLFAWLSFFTVLATMIFG